VVPAAQYLERGCAGARRHGRFEILSSTNLSGVFNTLIAPPGLGVTYSNNSVFLVVTGTVPPTLVGPAIVGTDFTFAFQSLHGKTYTVEYKNNFEAYELDRL